MVERFSGPDMSPRVPAVVLVVLALLAASPSARVRAAGLYPEGTDWSPTGDNEALNAAVRITWSARMNGTSVEGAFSLTDGTDTRDGSSFAWTHSSVPPWTSAATPLAALRPLAVYTVRVAPTARDATGLYALDQDGSGTGGEATDALSWTFRTEDGTPPTVVLTSPGDGQANVPVAADVAIDFDEPMDAASVEAAFNVTPEVRGAFSWEANATRVRFDPDLLLGYGTTYTVRVSGDARDANGARLDGNGDGTGGDEHAFTFTTEPDVEPPRALAVTPLPGTTSVSVSALIEIRFSEAMDRGSVEDAFSFSDGTATWGAGAGSPRWSGSAFADDTLSFNAFENFPFNAMITVTLNASLARDPAGFTLDGDGDGIAEGSPADDVAWWFRIEAADATKPRVTFGVPPDGATGVPETTDVLLEFSEPMNQTTVEDAFSLRDAVRTWTKADGWFVWTNEAVSYDTSTTLAFDSEYTVTLTTAAKDVNGNPLDGDGAGGNFTATFRTRAEPDSTPPHVVSTFPTDWQANVPRDTRIAITFDDAMDRSNTESAISMEGDGWLDPRPVPVGGFSWDAEDHAVSFAASNESLAWSATYTVRVSQAARDRAGNPLSSPYSFTFQIGPWTGRVVGSVVGSDGPVAGATVRIGTHPTQTTANGTFAFPSYAAGTYPLSISAEGYMTLRGTVILDARMAVDNATVIDLGEYRLQRAEGIPAALVAVVVLATAVAVAGVALVLRRRRIPEEAFEGMSEEPGP